MKLVSGVLLSAALAACASSSSSKSVEPVPPQPVQAQPAEPQAQPQPQMPSMAERAALSMKLYQRMIVWFESANGDCDTLAKRITVYSATDEAEVSRILADDEEFRAYERAYQEEHRVTYDDLVSRLGAVLSSCAADEGVRNALSASGLFKVRVVAKPMPAQADAE